VAREPSANRRYFPCGSWQEWQPSADAGYVPPGRPSGRRREGSRSRGDHVVAVALSGVPSGTAILRIVTFIVFFSQAKSPPRVIWTGEVTSYGFTFAVETW